MLPELLKHCQWMIFLAEVGVGVGDGVGDAGETETASKIRQHSQDTWTTRPKQVDKHRNSWMGFAAPMSRLRFEHAITAHRLVRGGEIRNLQVIQLVRSNSRASTKL